LAGGQSAEQLHARTLQRAFELEQQHGYEVHTVWECDWKQKLQRHPELRQLDSKAAGNVPGPMDLRRHALFGGRVEPYTLFYKCDPAVEEVIVLDIVSFNMNLTIYPSSLGIALPLRHEVPAIPAGSSGHPHPGTAHPGSRCTVNITATTSTAAMDTPRTQPIHRVPAMPSASSTCCRAGRARWRP